MEQMDRDNAVPFAATPRQMRRWAQERRRRGEMVEALELLRHAAQLDPANTPGLELVAEQLVRMCCYEQAANLYLALLPREDHTYALWLNLGRCLATLGLTRLARESLDHYLALDNSSSQALEAHYLLTDLEQEEEAPQSPNRAWKLTLRAMRMWGEGEEAKSQRALRRAVRISRDPGRLQTTLAEIDLARQRPEEALRRAAFALRRTPDGMRQLTLMARAMEECGYCRVALGFLRRALSQCEELPDEALLLHAMFSLNAWNELDRYLTDALTLSPYRAALHLARMRLFMVTGHREEMLRVARYLVRIDPQCTEAQEVLHPEDQPGCEAERPLGVLARLDPSTIRAEEALSPTSPIRLALDELFSTPSPVPQQRAVEVLEKLQGDSEPLKRYMKVLLTSLTTAQVVKQRLLLALFHLGETGPLTMVADDQYVTVQAQALENRRRSEWSLFLPRLLTYRQDRDAPVPFQREQTVEFAAAHWRPMREEWRHNALTDFLPYCVAAEALTLGQCGEENAELWLLSRYPRLRRKVQRAIRRWLSATGPAEKETALDDAQTTTEHDLEVQGESTSNEVHQF